MPRTYTSAEAFKEYSARIGYAADYREAMGVVQSAFSCLALTNDQVRELQAFAWKKNQVAKTERRVCMLLYVKGGGRFEIENRKEAEAARAAMRQYANLLIDGQRNTAQKKSIEITFRGKSVSILCYKVEGFE